MNLTKKVIVDPLAKLEFDDSVEYYESQVTGLGKRFRKEIHSGLRRIYENPETWPVEHGEIKRYLLHTFPFKILYSIEENYIYIIAFAHCHRRPGYWIERYAYRSS